MKGNINLFLNSWLLMVSSFEGLETYDFSA